MGCDKKSEPTAGQSKETRLFWTSDPNPEGGVHMLLEDQAALGWPCSQASTQNQLVNP